MIRYLLDADLPRSASQALRERGCDAVDVRDIGLEKAPDDTLFRYAVIHRYTRITSDKGFTNLLRFPLGTHAGLVVARFPPHTLARRKSRILTRWVVPLAENDVVGNLLIIEARGVRIRRAKP